MTKTIITVSDRNKEVFEIAVGRIAGVLLANDIDAGCSTTKGEKEGGLYVACFETDADYPIAMDAIEAACLTSATVIVTMIRDSK